MECYPEMSPRPEDFMHHVNSIHIDAPPETVWQYAGDLGRAVEWAASGQVQSIEKTSTGPVESGTTYLAHEKIGMRFDSESRVVVCEPNRALIWYTRPIGMSFPEGRAHRWAFYLELEDGGTRLTQELRAARASGMPRVMQRLMSIPPMKGRVIAGIDGTLDRIKGLAEGRATSAVPNPTLHVAH